MKLTIKRKSLVKLLGVLQPAVVLSVLFTNILIGSFVSGIGYLILGPEGLNQGGVLILAGLWFLPGLAYHIYKYIDWSMYVNSTQIELSEHGLTISSNRVRSSEHITVTFENLSGVSVLQNLTLKIFSLGSVVVQSESGDTLVTWGYEVMEARKFADEVMKKHRVAVRAR